MSGALRGSAGLCVPSVPRCPWGGRGKHVLAPCPPPARPARAAVEAEPALRGRLVAWGFSFLLLRVRFLGVWGPLACVPVGTAPALALRYVPCPAAFQTMPKASAGSTACRRTAWTR